MSLRDWFRRPPPDTDALDAIAQAEEARDHAVEQRAHIMRENDHIEDRVIRNHFAEAIVHSWADRRAT